MSDRVQSPRPSHLRPRDDAGSVSCRDLNRRVEPWADVGGAGGLLAKKLGLELTQGQIRSWSNLRNSEDWLPGRIATNYWKNSWLGGLIDGPRNVLDNYLTC